MRRPVLAMLGLLQFTAMASATDATAPAQPEAGPGGSAYVCAAVTFHKYGEGNTEYWLFEPADPTPKSGPLIIFNHGWTAMDPNSYGGWIKHLVRRGNIVIYPRYQATVQTPFKDFVPSAVAAIKAALVELQNGSHVRPELDHVAMVGHSMGGAMTPSIAAEAEEEGLPVPKAICCVEPGGPAMPGDLAKIPPSTLALVVVGDQDKVVGNATGKAIFESLTQIPAKNKDFVTLVSDDHGTPPLLASHFAPVSIVSLVPMTQPADAPGPFRAAIRRRLAENAVTVLDYYGTWKLFDGLTDQAFYGKNGKYALGNTPEQRFMGVWSDGVAVKELKVGE